MKPVFIERLLQPRYMWKAIQRNFWTLVLALRPFCNVGNYYGPEMQYAHVRRLGTLIGSHGWRCTAPGKMTYFED
jgi:hypothetical protein